MTIVCISLLKLYKLNYNGWNEQYKLRHLACSKVSAICPYPGPAESSDSPPTLFFLRSRLLLNIN